MDPKKRNQKKKKNSERRWKLQIETWPANDKITNSGLGRILEYQTLEPM
jgi:hypothetical protein